MRILVQRVSRACVRVDGEILGEIGPGLVLLVGVCPEDGPDQLAKICRKIVTLRIFNDEEGHFNRSLLDTGGHLLVVSQFTLYADVKKGRRPSFSKAASGPQARPVMSALIEAFRALGVAHVASGEFGAVMDVEIHNQGPVTINVDSDFL
jgi:D-tyrosyl-tRNA(Tyr) deacylase